VSLCCQSFNSQMYAVSLSLITLSHNECCGYFSSVGRSGYRFRRQLVRLRPLLRSLDSALTASEKWHHAWQHRLSEPRLQHVPGAKLCCRSAWLDHHRWNKRENANFIYSVTGIFMGFLDALCFVSQHFQTSDLETLSHQS